MENSSSLSLQRKTILAEGVLVMMAFLWGSTFPMVRWLLDSVGVGALALMAYRFALASLVLLPIAILRWRWLKRRQRVEGDHPDAVRHNRQGDLDGHFWWRSFTQGCLLVLAFASQSIGMIYTTAANSSIITGLNIVLIPLMAPLFGRRRPAAIIYVAALICFGGLCLITGVHEIKIMGGGESRLGDFLTLICAFLFALHVICIAMWTHDHDVLLFGLSQIFCAAVMFTALALIFESPFPATGWALVTATALGVLCTAIPGVGATWAQRYISESHCALIYSGEPLVGASLGILVLSEPFGWNFALGGGLVLGGILLARPSAKRQTGEEDHSLKANAPMEIDALTESDGGGLIDGDSHPAAVDPLVGAGGVRLEAPDDSPDDAPKT